ncbi:phosphopantetheine-binding protein [Magnetospirillum sp. 15-1]|uniref:phosphopantetheine-binding protein n=1 Tax=Magnetospirillum sp. 15-1 TaxID=1979370 RepID=UPI000BBBD816|nr:phosphopantetheine-binding protein [Magnetospirillum sp. 15-1]
MDALELELKHLIVSALKLEDLSPEDIGSDEPLFGDSGLGLDSIDALELGVAIRKAYGIKIETVSDEVKRHFANIRNLAQFISANNEVKA